MYVGEILINIIIIIIDIVVWKREKKRKKISFFDHDMMNSRQVFLKKKKIFHNNEKKNCFFLFWNFSTHLSKGKFPAKKNISFWHLWIFLCKSSHTHTRNNGEEIIIWLTSGSWKRNGFRNMCILIDWQISIWNEENVKWKKFYQIIMTINHIILIIIMIIRTKKSIDHWTLLSKKIIHHEKSNRMTINV